jgi:hypothetical protein
MGNSNNSKLGVKLIEYSLVELVSAGEQTLKLSESSQMVIFNKQGGSESSVVLLFGLAKDRL